jgi:hypothetical protein
MPTPLYEEDTEEEGQTATEYMMIRAWESLKKTFMILILIVLVGLGWFFRSWIATNWAVIAICIICIPQIVAPLLAERWPGWRM